MTDYYKDNLVIQRFRQYLQIRTCPPNSEKEKCVNFLLNLAKELNLQTRVLELSKGFPIVILTWTGTDSHLPTIILSSHYDVVPVSESFWECDPFAAVVRENGDIIARGAQDMKCVGMAYLEAIKSLKAADFVPRRSIHCIFTPDEEVGSANGSELLVQSTEFKGLNAGIVLDEGVPVPHECIQVFNSERVAWWIKVEALGNAGHGSSLIQNTANEKLLSVLTKFSAWRAEEVKKLAGVQGNLGKVCSLNITMISTGKQANVIPEKAEAIIDIRISPDHSLTEIKERIDSIVHSHPQVAWSFIQSFDKPSISPVAPENPHWQAIERAFKECEMNFEVNTFPGGTDSRHYRSVGVPSYGISPFTNTPLLLHDHNEFLNAEVYLKGIKFYEKFLTQMNSI